MSIEMRAVVVYSGEEGVVVAGGEERSMWENANAERRRPTVMPGIERRRIRRRPMRSMRVKARRVNRRFVEAMSMLVPVGFVKLRREKMVAEKYMSEFYHLLAKMKIRSGAWMQGTYKPTKLLQPLQHAHHGQCPPTLPIPPQIQPPIPPPHPTFLFLP